MRSARGGQSPINAAVALSFAAWLALVPAPDAVAQAAAPSPAPARVRVDVVALDLPFNTANGYSFPSMSQSLASSRDFYQLAHHGIRSWVGPEHRARGFLAIAAFDFLAGWLPLGEGWLHEERHRAVLSRRGIGSFNDIYKFQLFKETIAVSRVRDEDLVRLKREQPAEQVRLASAGIEAQYELNLELEKRAFFEGSNASDAALLWSNVINSALYVFTCGTKEADTLTDEANADDGRDVRRRDFTGLDFTAWAYDLHRPHEPYEARGIHPSGVGIDRYRRFSDLSRDEQDYLKQQGRLQFLNMLDPNLFGRRGFTARGGRLRWNLSLRHQLTSFGYALDANLFLKRGGASVLAIAHNYVNGERYFPGLEVQLWRRRVRLGGADYLLSPRLMLWLQPEAQAFRTDSVKAGGLAALRIGRALGGRLEPYLELEGKTAGWVAGIAHLDRNVALRVGVSALLF